MKVLLSLLIAIAGATSFAKDTKREVAAIKKPLKMAHGTSTARAEDASVRMYTISIAGDSAKFMFNSIASEARKGESSSKEEVYYKQSNMIVCEKAIDKEEKTTSYNCDVQINDGFGAAG